MSSTKNLTILFLLAAACGQSRQPAPRPADAANMQTLESAGARPSLFDPPPMLTQEAAAPKPHNAIAAQNMIPLTPADEMVRGRLPFAPAIAMDPVDGSKISIRADTPILDLKNRIYYFSSEDNKRTFAANPDQFTKGLFSHL